MLKPLLLPVTAAALIDGRGRVLLQRRPAGKQHAGCWELPGGKVEPHESPEAALVRELAEELAIEVAAADLVPMAFASEPAGARHLLLLCFAVRRWKGEPQALAADALAWMTPAETAALPMPPADRPLLAALARMA
jgi:8-oxo-dGTP diphosphatase